MGGEGSLVTICSATGTHTLPDLLRYQDTHAPLIWPGPSPFRPRIRVPRAARCNVHLKSLGTNLRPICVQFPVAVSELEQFWLKFGSRHFGSRFIAACRQGGGGRGGRGGRLNMRRTSPHAGREPTIFHLDGGGIALVLSTVRRTHLAFIERQRHLSPQALLALGCLAEVLAFCNFEALQLLGSCAQRDASLAWHAARSLIQSALGAKLEEGV